MQGSTGTGPAAIANGVIDAILAAPLAVLVLAGNLRRAGYLENALARLQRPGPLFYHSSSLASAEQVLHRHECTLVLVDLVSLQQDASAVLQRCRAVAPDATIVAIHPAVHEAAQCAALRAGADEIVPDELGTAGHLRRRVLFTLNRRRLSPESLRLAHYDPLTGLLNRGMFMERLQHAVRMADRQQSGLAILYFDLDQFKQVNDSLGHAAGDDLLRGVATRVQETLRDSDTPARLGGDEFAVLLEALTCDHDAYRVADKLREAIGKPLEISGQDLSIGSSFGVALMPQDGSKAADLLTTADRRMLTEKAARSAGASYVAVATRPLQLGMPRRRGMSQCSREVAAAFRAGEIRMHFQPQLDLGTGRVCAVEALARWQRARDDVLAPARFLPALEEVGLIERFGVWTLARALDFIQLATPPGREPIRVAINLSSRQVLHRGLEDYISHLDPARRAALRYVEIELTEQAMSASPGALGARLQDLRQAGIRVALDDFGTGYNSFAYLRRFPVDTLKIDQSLIAGIEADPVGQAMVCNLIDMAAELGLRVVGEGVETSVQLALLRAGRCGVVQGYLVSRPLEEQACLQGLAGDHFTRCLEAA